jgi:hypothetical protein
VYRSWFAGVQADSPGQRHRICQHRRRLPVPALHLHSPCPSLTRCLPRHPSSEHNVMTLASSKVLEVPQGEWEAGGRHIYPGLPGRVMLRSMAYIILTRNDRSVGGI